MMRQIHSRLGSKGFVLCATAMCPVAILLCIRFVHAQPATNTEATPAGSASASTSAEAAESNSAPSLDGGAPEGTTGGVQATDDSAPETPNASPQGLGDSQTPSKATSPTSNRTPPAPQSPTPISAVPTPPPSVGDVPAEGETIEVTVAGKRPGSADDGYRANRGYLGAFGELSLKDVPFSLNVTRAALWENRNAHTEQEVLRTNPTVSDLMSPLAPGGGGMSRTMVRGGTMGDQGVLRDGLVDRGFTFPWFENVERVEAMNGLSSLLYGFGTLGGTVNYVSKRPKPKPYGSIAIGDYGGGINYATGDFSGTVPLLNSDQVRYRSVVHEEYGKTFVAGSTERRTLLTTMATYRPSEKTELSADIAYQHFYVQGMQNYIDVNPSKGIFVPDASIINPRWQYGQPWTFSESNKILVGAAAKAPVSDAITVRAAYRHGTMWRDYNTTFGTFTDNQGDYTETYVTTPRQFERTDSAYALADIQFATGPLKHHVTTGYNGTTFYYERGNDVKTALGTSNVGAPLNVQFAPNWANAGSANASRTYYDSLILGDRAVWRWLTVLAGINYAQIRAKAWAFSSVCTTAGQCPGNGPTDSTQGAFTPSVGFVVHPIVPLALYGSYMEGLSQGGTAPANAQNAYQIMPSSHSRQIEFGAKGNLADLQWTLATFRINQVSEYLDPTDNYYKQDGRQTNQGLEATATGPVAGGFSLIGGFTLMRAEITKARNNPALEGKVPVNVPEKMGRLFLDYAIPFTGGLSLDLGANYNGKRYVDNLNTDSFDSSVTFDAGARYERLVSQHKVSATLFITNLADERYWAYYRSGSGLLAGAPRTLSLSAKVGLW